ncbi:uncharacterized protein Dwil_GK16638 [Drosophila willistoni]|uniref:Uncharacterized protein n=1 Tax=Drosophila willistoni TaxID=7260 RepID=B4MMQ3_DROWI|nr:uncharacterized protein Dwil_GK16638 [Drosophila willistoni]
MDADEANGADKSPAGKRRKMNDNNDQENASWNNILAQLEASEQEMAEEAPGEDVSAIQAVIGCNELQNNNNKEPEPNDPVELPPTGVGSTTPIPMPNEVDDFLSGSSVATGTYNQEQFLPPGSVTPNPTGTPTPTPNDEDDFLSTVAGNSSSDSSVEESPNYGAAALGNIFGLGLRHGISFALPQASRFRRFFSDSDSDDSERDGRRVRRPTVFRIHLNNDFIIHNANNDEHNNGYYLPGLRDAQLRMSRSLTRRFSDDISSSSRSSSIMNPSISSDSFDDDNDPGLANITNMVNAVIEKPKPAYTFNLTRELMQRESNNINRVGARGGHISEHSFNNAFNGSRQVVERMTLLGRMNHHRRCVNCLDFNEKGNLICSGSDDRHIAVWDWAKRKQLHKFKSGHALNIFQTKFIESKGYLDIVSTSRDGQVMRSIVPPSGATSIKSTRLYWHAGSVPKIALVPQSPHEMMSAGEDAAIMHYDLRSSHPATTLVRCMKSDDVDNLSLIVRLYSIAHHPHIPEFCVAGSDDKVRVYDKRKVTKPLYIMTPDPYEEHLTQITCVVYNHSGTEILASYKDSGIFLYDSRNCNGGILRTYRGHLNSRTIKGVNFFGPHSEYVVTGSDCGHIIFYDKNTEAIINYVKDGRNIVNCLESHPSLPILATSGLEHDVKLWAPHGSNTAPYNTDALRKLLTRNFSRQSVNTGDYGRNQFHSLMREFITDDEF